MVEGFSWDTVQILKEKEVELLKEYVHNQQLNIDITSLEEGKGVLILHDHMLTPKQEKHADEVVGEPVYFKTMISRNDAIQSREECNYDREKSFSQKSSEMFKLCGYLDSRSDEFPEIDQSWHGAEDSQ